jgi:O-antigen/teichoic acid export membrane protein
VSIDDESLTLSPETEFATGSKKGFKERILQAFSWSFIGYVFNQLLRLGSNLILARLFLPEAFGIMQLVFVFIQAISMLSDLGIHVNIVQHKNGEDASFLRTAWTVQILRGILIEVILIAIAFPLASIYHVEALKWLIPLAGVNAILDALTSTNIVMLNRNLLVRRLTLLESGTQFIGTVAMILGAWYFRAVWTLLIAGFVSGLLKTLYSHLYLPGPRMKLAMVKNDLHEIIHFGKWIFISSLGGFLVSRMDRVILGLYITIENLGLYGIAYALGMMMFDLLQAINYKVLIPLYSRVWRDNKSELPHQTFKVRGGLMLITLLPLLPAIVWGKEIIQFLYPQTYWGAGWMLQIITFACCLKCIALTYGPILYATGDSFRAMLLMISSSVIFIISLILGGHFYGTSGIIWAIPISEIITYPIVVWSIYRYGVWSPLLDLAGFIVTIIIVYCSF